MVDDLIIAPEAVLDLLEAYAWYERRRVGLGEEFLGCVDACIERIARMPDLYEIVHENYQRALVRRFPYAVLYEFENSVLTIFCIFHTARDPKKWRERLP
jgi:plasmid stabilization system protein ParE